MCTVRCCHVSEESCILVEEPKSKVQCCECWPKEHGLARPNQSQLLAFCFTSSHPVCSAVLTRTARSGVSANVAHSTSAVSSCQSGEATVPAYGYAIRDRVKVVLSHCGGALRNRWCSPPADRARVGRRAREIIRADERDLDSHRWVATL